MSMRPRDLDFLINGAKVYIYRRPSDGHIYASLMDFSRFGASALTIVRVPLTEKSTPDSVLQHRDVEKAIKRYSKRVAL